MKNPVFTVYYFAIGLLVLVLDAYKLFYPTLILKATIIPALMIYYHYKVKKRYCFLHILILSGLFFAWLGDIFFYVSGNRSCIEVNKTVFFLIAISFFSLTQISYIIAFFLPKGRNPVLNRRIYLLFLVIAYGALIIWLLYRGLGDMRVPVIIYTFLILTMFLAALNRHGKVNGVSFMLVSLGALFFVISDSMLAINKFYQKIDFARILIMSSYVIAQYLIATGCIKQDEKSFIKNKN